MQIVRTPNIRFNKHMEINGMDMRPDRGESLGRKWIGPFKKNFDIPNELANKLKRKVPTGRASLKVLNVDIVLPNSSFG